MARLSVLKSSFSTKGQLVVPKQLRDEKQWSAGTSVVFESTPKGIWITAEVPEKTFTVEDIIGILKHEGTPKSVSQMNEAAQSAAIDRYRRGLR